MKQWFSKGGVIEVSDLSPEREVRQECSARDNVRSELPVFIEKHHEPAERESRDENNNQRREDAPDAPRVKVPEGEAPAFQTAKNYGADQKSGNDKKHVGADIATLNEVWERMKTDGKCDRQATEPVNIRPVFHM